MRRPTCRRAFTLVELLIVLGIIVALAGLLFPMIGRAREAAKRTQCLSNLRQLTLAWLAYAGDNDRHLCPGGTWHTTDPKTPIKSGRLWPYLNSTDPYRCPDDRSDPKINPSSYAVNGLLAGSAPFTRLDDIPSAPSTFVFIEPANPRAGSAPSVFGSPIYPNYFYTSSPGVNHRGYKAYAEGTGISFADGHAIFWTYTDPRSGIGGPAPNSPDVYQLEAWSGGPVPPDVRPLVDPVHPGP